MILRGTAPDNLLVQGDLDFSLADCPPARLPAGLQVRRLIISGARKLEQLPSGLRCYDLLASETGLKSLPADIQVTNVLNLSDSKQLESLPAGLKAGSLQLQNCVALKELPNDLQVIFLNISGCQGLTEFPQRGPATLGRLNMRDCRNLRQLPGWLKIVGQLDISDCPLLEELPQDLQVRSWLDVANTPLRGLPATLNKVQLRWHAVRVPQRVVFEPETITAEEVFAEDNVELRRVLVERMDQEVFMRNARVKVIDEDQDPGGVRRLLKVEMAGDEPLVHLSVKCPSTAHSYLLRVPPAMKSCRQAVAWIAGFDNPDDYRPLIET
ncbi:hypothetical protein KDA_46210 [Dictyobacter alpinus]|uniref:DUF6745 domain-containing protein n=1 Tax=Dictyobacter alpinus TaxID=2014873 RepID=A0A402BCX6_9CHLR|nr:hypothetical protein KDA_46210 [Dictyobacter alpinus]